MKFGVLSGSGGNHVQQLFLDRIRHRSQRAPFSAGVGIGRSQASHRDFQTSRQRIRARRVEISAGWIADNIDRRRRIFVLAEWSRIDRRHQPIQVCIDLAD